VTGDDWASHAERAADLALAAGHDRTAVVFLLEILTASDLADDRRAALAGTLGETAAWGSAALDDLADRVVGTLRTVLGSGVSSAARGEIRLSLGRLLFQLGRFDAAADEVEVALTDLDSRPDLAARAMTMMAFPRGQDWPAQRHRRWLDRSGEPTARVTSMETRISLTVDRASALLMMGDVAGWQVAEEITVVADRADLATPERRQLARGLMNVGHLGVAWGRYQESGRLLGRATALMRATGYERLLNSATLTQAHLDWQTGRWDGLSEQVAAVADESGTLPEARLEAQVTLGLLALSSGERGIARERLRDVLEESTRRGLIDVRTTPAGALGRLLLADGEPADALAVTEPIAHLLATKGMWVWATDVLVTQVEALVQLDRTSEAVRWSDWFAAGLGDTPAPAAQAASILATAITAAATGQPTRALSLFDDAKHAWAAMPRPYYELLTLERLCAVRLAGDEDAETDAALRTLTTAEQRLRAMGASWDADRVARTLRQHGVDVARIWRGGRRGYGDHLSPREFEVVQLVAAGWTNRQVAGSLFLSTRTVDRHLSAAMRKLGVTSRTAVAMAAHHAGLLGGDPDTAQSPRADIG